MQKGIIGQQIKKARLEKDWTQEELARKIGVRQPAVTRWESGENSPLGDLIPDLAVALEKSLGFFYGLDNGPLVLHSEAVITIPYYAHLPCGPGRTMEEEPEGTLEVPSRVAGRQDFTVRVCGHSLEPLLSHGEFVAFRWVAGFGNGGTEPTDGKVVLAFLLESETVTAKKFRSAGGTWWLEDGLGNRLEEEAQVRAVAIWACRDL